MGDVAGTPVADFEQTDALIGAGISSATTGAVTEWKPVDANARWTDRVQPYLPWLVFVWGVGVGMFSLRLSLSLIWLHRIRSGSAPVSDDVLTDLIDRVAERLKLLNRPRLLQSPKIDVPMVLGVARPVILVPAAGISGLTVDQWEMILTHELAHIRRRDHLVNALQVCVETVLFYHPAVWWISRQIRAERENCCDDVASRLSEPTEYAEALYVLEQSRCGRSPALAVASDGGALKKRIQRLVAPDPAVRAGSRWLPILLFLGLALTTAVAINPGARGSDDPFAPAESETADEETVDERGPSSAPEQPSKSGTETAQPPEQASTPDSDQPKSDEPAGEAPEAAPSPYRGRGELKDALLETYGGNDQTEAAVKKGLQWLSTTQHADGSWRFESAQGFAGGTKTRSVAATAMALLAFQGAGHTHLAGDHQEPIQRALRWLLSQAKEDGSYDAREFYTHGLCVAALSEAYGMTGDESLREPAQRAIAHAVKAQDPKGGGWRYMPRQAGDMSATGWVLCGLYVAHISGLDVPKDALQRAKKFIASARVANGPESYSYIPGGGPSPSTTAIGILCCQQLQLQDSGGRRDEGIGVLAKHLKRVNIQKELYYVLFASQVMRNVGGEDWLQWNARLKKEFPEMQSADGSFPAKHAKFGAQLGPHYSTCLAVLTMEVYYRYLPPATKQDTAADQASSKKKSSPPASPKPKPPADKDLLLTGTVTDSDSGKPIPKFRMVPGVPFNRTDGKQSVATWQPHLIMEFTDGKIAWPRERGYKQMRFYIEADGYSPWIVDWTGKEDPAQELDIKLTKRNKLFTVVFDPKGKVAEGAVVAITQPNRTARLENGEFVGAGDPVPEKLSQQWRRPIFARTAAQGLAFVPYTMGPSVTLAVTHPSGYYVGPLHGLIEEVQKQTDAALGVSVQLLPWSKLSGRVMHQGQGVAGAKVRLSYMYDQIYPGMVEWYPSTETDSKGYYQFDHVPNGGRLNLSHEIRIPAAGDTPEQSHTFNNLLINIEPGENRVVNLGAADGKVHGQLEGLESYQLVTVAVGPPAPQWAWRRNLKNNAMDAFLKLKQSEIGPAYFREGIKVDNEGRFTIEGLPTGRYTLTVRKPEALISGSASFTILNGEPAASITLDPIKVSSVERPTDRSPVPKR